MELMRRRWAASAEAKTSGGKTPPGALCAASPHVVKHAS